MFCMYVLCTMITWYNEQFKQIEVMSVTICSHFAAPTLNTLQPMLILKVAPNIYSQHLKVTVLCLPMKFKRCSVPKSCFTAPSDTACVDLFSHMQSKHNTCWRTLIHHVFQRNPVSPAPHTALFSPYFTLYRSQNKYPSDWRHIYILDSLTLKWKTSWTEQGKRSQVIVFQGY